MPSFAQTFLCSPHLTFLEHWLGTGFSAPPCAALAAARRFGRCWRCPMRPAVLPCSKQGQERWVALGGRLLGMPAGLTAGAGRPGSWRLQPAHRLACWWRSTSKHSGGCRKTQRSAYRQKPRECQCLHTGASGSASASVRAASSQLRCLHGQALLSVLSISAGHPQQGNPEASNMLTSSHGHLLPLPAPRQKVSSVGGAGGKRRHRSGGSRGSALHLVPALSVPTLGIVQRSPGNIINPQAKHGVASSSSVALRHFMDTLSLAAATSDIVEV
jgi:hypothetical protein